MHSLHIRQECVTLFIAGAFVFCVFAVKFNFIHLKREKLTVIHLLRTVGLFLLLSSVKKYAKLKMPPQRVALRCCNNDDCCQWQKQGEVVGAAASKTQARAKRMLGAATRPASAGGHASLRQASGGRKSLLFVPPFANAEGGMHHGVERCSAAVRHCWRYSWNYISDRMGNLQRDP